MPDPRTTTSRQGIAFVRTAFGRVSTALGLAALVSCLPATRAADSGQSSGELLQQLRELQETGSVLYVAAHPDDENNRLLPYLAHGRALRTAYLSLTRGDGGQNLIGPELGAELGVIRTQELLAARRVDGAAQYFSRARDFGFSKDAADTLRRWDRTQVLTDIVRVIRLYRPDVVITRFSTVPGGTHGHHTASAILAAEAFKLAGDPSAFSDQLGTLPPWQPTRLLWNSWNPQGRATTDAGTIHLDAGGFDPLIGESFGETGSRGRSMHKSQGEGRPTSRGTAMENFTLLDGTPATADLLDGIDHSWARFQGGAPIGAAIGDVIAHFDALHPEASVPALLEIRTKLAGLDSSDSRLAFKRAQLDRILQGCLGLFVETVLPDAEVVPGETMALKHTAIVRAHVPVRWLGIRYPGVRREVAMTATDLPPDETVTQAARETLPVDAPLTHPYWLREDGTEGMFRVDDASLIGLAEAPPVFPVEFVFSVGGQTLVVHDVPVQVIVDPVRGEQRRPLDVIAPVSLTWEDNLALVAPGGKATAVLELRAARRGSAGMLRVEPPSGWTIAPAEVPFDLAAVGERREFAFTVTAPAAGGSAEFLPRATIGERSYQRGRTEIRYDHIPVQLLQSSAILKVASFAVENRARRVGFVPGAGDALPEALRRLGCAVTVLNAGDLAAEKLANFDAVVVGIRAFNTRSDLESLTSALSAYAEHGGTVVLQYNTANGLRAPLLGASLNLTLSGDRVTRADAPVTLLAPNHPALRSPNAIGPADFGGWLQERARNIPKTWDSRFVPLLAMNDPGESPLRGALLVADKGKGHVAYVSLSLFRELPAGVPGAYRLLANLISLGR